MLGIRWRGCFSSPLDQARRFWYQTEPCCAPESSTAPFSGPPVGVNRGCTPVWAPKTKGEKCSFFNVFWGIWHRMDRVWYWNQVQRLAREGTSCKEKKSTLNHRDVGPRSSKDRTLPFISLCVSRDGFLLLWQQRESSWRPWKDKWDNKGLSLSLLSNTQYEMNLKQVMTRH